MHVLNPLRILFGLLVGTLATAGVAAQPPDPQPPASLDGFEDTDSWQIIEAEGVSLRVAGEPGRNGMCARLDYDFTRGSGYAIIRKEFDLDLPSNYRFSYSIRGAGPSNTIEFKLVDASGDNVWWVNQRDFQFSSDWETVTLSKRKFSFAWGPSAGKPLGQARHIEIVVTSFNGGRGTVWLDDLRFEPLPEVQEYKGSPTARGSSPAGALARTIGADGAVGFTSQPGDERPSLVIDFGQVREIGGLVLDWGPGHATDYDVHASNDGEHYSPAAQVRGSNGGRDYVPLPSTTARALTIQTLPTGENGGVSVRAVRFLPPEFADSSNELLRHAAIDSPRGWYPRYLKGEATYWTVVGVPGDDKEALINEEGSIEVDKLAFSLEPFVFTGGRLVSWNDSTNTQSLEEGYLPIPSVRRVMPGLELEIKAFAEGAPGASNLLVRYELNNTGVESSEGTLYIAARPMQVNPPYQNLNITGGASSVRRIHFEDSRVRLDGRTIVPLTGHDGFGATAFDGGEIVEYLARGELPDATSVEDPRGLASAALAYAFRLGPGERKVVGVLVPFHDLRPLVQSPPSEDTLISHMDARLAPTREVWHDLLDRVKIRLPKGNEQVTDSLHANLAYILINRDGSGIQPGSRCYERTWIRDGALTSTALLSMGLGEVVQEFLDWFAPFQYDSGKVPCCVDRRGPDPVPEHDSHGEYIYAVHTCFAFTGDMVFLARHYPHVVRAVEFIEFLRNQRMTDEYFRGPDHKRVLFGLMPESISHEGYSAKPMHSYWDGLWTLKGLIDATRIAELMGDHPRAARFAALRDSFEQTLYESMRLAMTMKGIDFIPGCAELGDFDATSTTVGLFPCGQIGNLPEPQLTATFEKYWTFFQSRRDGTLEWRDYTPYEQRVVGSMVLLGHRDRAHEILDFFFRDQRPRGWRHWAEVVRRDPREQGFIGDMPHTWVGADFINSVRLMLAYVRDKDGALILGAGLPRAWLEATDGVDVGDLRTEFGPLSYSAKGTEGLIRIAVQSLEHMPEGGVHFHLPDPSRIRSLTLAGSKIDVPADGMVRLPLLPAALEVRYLGADE